MIDLQHGDCLELMKNIPDKSIDMILCDLPYGIHSSKWDSVIDFDLLWAEYTRIIKSKRAIVLFAREPFASNLRLSNAKMYKYDWIWKKNQSGDVLNAKLKPMNIHENICVFSDGYTANCNRNNMLYNPQGLLQINKITKSGNKKGKDATHWRPSTGRKRYVQQYTNYPTTVLEFAKPHKAVHPTQKPVALCEYLIKTYTNEGEIVLDSCMGSGTTGVACVNTDRNFIGIELDDHYFEVAQERINQAQLAKSSN